MTITLSSKLEIPRARFKEKNKVVNDALHCQQSQFILMMKTMLRNKDTTLMLINELIKLNDFNDFLSLAELTNSVST